MSIWGMRSTMFREKAVVNKCLYSVLRINLEGHKEILGIWIPDNESAGFWITVCNELKK